MKTAAVITLAALGTASALAYGVPSTDRIPRVSESRIAEIAAALPEKPGAPGAPATDRAAWARLAAMPEAADVIAAAEGMAARPTPKLGDYHEYFRNGNRKNYETTYFARTRRFNTLALAECLEGKGRFIKPFEAELKALLDMRSWCVPAHDRYANGKLGPATYEGKLCFVDLFASECGWAVALAVDRLAAFLPADLVARARAEVVRRVVSPVLKDIRERPYHPFHTWMYCFNNWNSVCHCNTVSAALIALEDRRARAELIETAERAQVSYLSGIGSDGYCSEGMGYWNYGFGREIALGMNVRAATGGKVDFLAGERLRVCAAFARDFLLEDGFAPRFADGGSARGPAPDILALASDEWPDLFPAAGSYPVLKSPFYVIALRGFPPRDVVSAKAVELPPRSFFEEAQVLISRLPPVRGTPAFSAAIKGGHNAEHHNHNDIGAYVIALGGEFAAGDPGGEVYTRRTFSPMRYESKVLNSFGHPVPVANGCLQSTGRKYAAKLVGKDFSDSADTLAIDIAPAYDGKAGLKSLVRTFVCDRQKRVFSVSDKVEFSAPGTFESPIVTECEPVFGNDPSCVTIKTSRGDKLDVRVSVSGGKWHWKTELLENPGRPSNKRLAVVMDEPVASAEITVEYSAGSGKTAAADAAGEAALASALPGQFAKCAAHYRALDAAATPLMKDEKGKLRMPHGFRPDSRTLDMRSVRWWTAGHYPGSLWLLHEATGDNFFKERAIAWTATVAENSKVTDNHDVGFIMYCSFGTARRITGSDEHDALLLEAAASLSQRFNPELGLIRSWGKISDEKSFLVIPDNMMNLELLEWAAKAKGGDVRFDKIARSHADVTMRNHFRSDGGTYHVLNYEMGSGRVQEIRRGQGASCLTAWSRGQSWAIYGYTMMYRETGDRRYLEFAQKVSDYAIHHKNMPADGVPFWDYGAPGEERDSSAASIMASGLLELAAFTGGEKGAEYRAFAVKQLRSLSSDRYFSKGDEIGHWLLKHGVGHKPGNSEIDVPLDYGDYYYLEALLRFRKSKGGN